LNYTLFQEVFIVAFRFVPFVGTGHLHRTVFEACFPRQCCQLSF